MQKATRQQTKVQNRNLVLRTISERDTTSRAEIARITRLTRTTVSDIVNDLLDEGLVQEIGTGSSIGGKSPILINLVEDARYILAMDLAYNQFSGAIVNLNGKIRKMVSLPMSDSGNEVALEAAYSIIDQLLQYSYHPLIGISVGAAGLINSHDGIVRHSVNLDWVNLPLGKLLEERYGLPVYLLNDCQALAIGEYRFGKLPATERNMVVVRVGQGIGAGIIINGQIFHGDGGSAGEIGHIQVVHENGYPCRCGNTGCLETIASTRAVLRQMTELNHQAKDLSLEDAKKAFNAGDDEVQKIVLKAGESLGSVIASLVSTLNIHDIVITGDMINFGSPWLRAIHETFRTGTLIQLTQETNVRFGSLTDNGVILGASALMANDYSLLFQRQ